ncbi:hypothetical protein ACF0H5_003930 [Mactra antiquata]
MTSCVWHDGNIYDKPLTELFGSVSPAQLTFLQFARLTQVQNDTSLIFSPFILHKSTFNIISDGQEDKMHTFYLNPHLEIRFLFINISQILSVDYKTRDINNYQDT